VDPRVDLAPDRCHPIHPRHPRFCFEALWDESKALCVSHERFEQLPNDCQKTQFSNPIYFSKQDGGVVTGPTETVVYCRSNDYNATLAGSRIKNRSFINSLDGGVHGCVNEIPCP